jgi:RNA polymerase subunit RPABC4/transcription elongation factor Spt4
MTPPPALYTPLASTLLCLNCFVTFQAGHQQCPACTSSHITPISRWLDKEGK